jgi:DNA-binding NtrC family response regulator
MNTYVLLVDDEVPFVETMIKRLEKRDLQVTAAHGGEEGLEKLRENPRVDVVILDVKMPGMDGIETLREMKRIRPLTEVVMLTGHATVESAIDGMKIGAFDYLMKPCEMEQLMAKIREAARKKRDHEQKIVEAEAMNIALRRGD